MQQVRLTAASPARTQARCGPAAPRFIPARMQRMPKSSLALPTRNPRVSDLTDTPEGSVPQAAGLVGGGCEPPARLSIGRLAPATPAPVTPGDAAPPRRRPSDSCAPPP